MAQHRIDFICIGAQKAGTTALYEHLKFHPEIEMSGEKELHFFDHIEDLTSNEINKYHKNFKFYDGKLTGEITPSYIYDSNVPIKLFQYNPKIKLIVILRNPIERAISQFNMNRNNGVEKNNFILAIVKELIQLHIKKVKPSLTNSYISRGLYAKQLKVFLNIIPKEQILIIEYDKYVSDQLNTLKKIYSFLDIEVSNKYYKKTRNNITVYNYKPSKFLRLLLWLYFFQDMQKLKFMLNWNLYKWK